MLALALAFATAAWPGGGAVGACLPPPAGQPWEPLDDLPGLPDGWTPYLALDGSRLPPVPTVVAANNLQACDLTNGLALFVQAARVGDAEQRAVLAAATLFPDALGVPQPTRVARAGDAVEVETWSERNGLVVAWRVDPATLAASFTVREAGVGAFVPETAGWATVPGFTDADARGSHDLTLAQRVLMCPNADGSAWRFTYDTSRYASPAEADAYAAAYCEAAKTVYDLQVVQWGFASVDPDRVFDVFMDGCSCIFGSDQVEIHVHAKLESLAQLLGLTYPTWDHWYRSVIGHEWHHHLQWSINRWALSRALLEGGARLSETLFEPEGAHQAGALVYHNSANGFPRMLTHPNTALASRVYDAGLLWGYLYGQAGGLPFLKALYDRADEVSGDANHALALAVTLALRDVGAPHASFEDAYDDFAVAMLTGSFVWAPPGGAPREWGLFLPALFRQSFVAVGGVPVAEATGLVQPRALTFATLAPSPSMVTHFVAPEGSVRGRWLATDAGGTVTAFPAAATTPLVGGPWTDVTFVATRGFHPLSYANGMAAPGAFVAVVERGP